MRTYGDVGGKGKIHVNPALLLYFSKFVVIARVIDEFPLFPIEIIIGGCLDEITASPEFFYKHWR